jgi:hypothetical protein
MHSTSSRRPSGKRRSVRADEKSTIAGTDRKIGIAAKTERRSRMRTMEIENALRGAEMSAGAVTETRTMDNDMGSPDGEMLRPMRSVRGGVTVAANEATATELRSSENDAARCLMMKTRVVQHRSAHRCHIVLDHPADHVHERPP